MSIPNILGIIPARSGSKTIPDKNIYPVCGKPLIRYTIDVAEESSLDKYVITTDSEEYIEIIQERTLKKGKVMRRPVDLVQDESLMIDTLKYTMLSYEKLNSEYVDAIMWLQPTIPLRSTEDVNACLSLYESAFINEPNDIDFGNQSLITVYPIHNGIKIYDNNLRPILYQGAEHRKGVNKSYYVRNGAVFIASRNLIMNNRIMSDEPIIYIMPEERSIDIDSYYGLFQVESLINCMNTKNILEKIGKGDNDVRS